LLVRKQVPQVVLIGAQQLLGLAQPLSLGLGQQLTGGEWVSEVAEQADEVLALVFWSVVHAESSGLDEDRADERRPSYRCFGTVIEPDRDEL
jgi:hypothetical protein